MLERGAGKLICFARGEYVAELGVLRREGYKYGAFVFRIALRAFRGVRGRGRVNARYKYNPYLLNFSLRIRRVYVKVILLKRESLVARSLSDN